MTGSIGKVSPATARRVFSLLKKAFVGVGSTRDRRTSYQLLLFRRFDRDGIDQSLIFCIELIAQVGYADEVSPRRHVSRRGHVRDQFADDGQRGHDGRNGGVFVRGFVASIEDEH